VTSVLSTVPMPVPEASVPTVRLPRTGVEPPPDNCAVPPLLTMGLSPAQEPRPDSNSRHQTSCQYRG